MMHPDIREIFHELRQHKDELVRATQRIEHMSQALTQATAELANAASNLKVQVDNATTFIQSVPGRIQDAINSAGNDGDAVAAVQAVTAQLKAEGDVLSAALQTPPPAPAPPAPATPAA
jgi:ABC-type transporter Mla subunit MlaD